MPFGLFRREGKPLHDRHFSPDQGAVRLFLLPLLGGEQVFVLRFRDLEVEVIIRPGNVYASLEGHGRLEDGDVVVIAQVHPVPPANGHPVPVHRDHRGEDLDRRVLEDHGKFINPWVEKPFLWFVDDSQTKVEGYDCEKITNDLTETFPERVRRTINGD